MTQSTDININDISLLDELSRYTLELKKKIEQANQLDHEYQQKLGFQSGDLNFILSESQHAEILKTPDLCVIPQTPLWFKGMINLRGNLLPVFDISLLISNVPCKSSEWIMVFRDNEQMAALCINELPATIKMEEAEHCSSDLLAEGLLPFTQNAYKHKKHVWCEADYSRLFTLFHEKF